MPNLDKPFLNRDGKLCPKTEKENKNQMQQLNITSIQSLSIVICSFMHTQMDM